MTVLLAGVNHVAVLTNDSDRLHAFYREVFGAEVFHDMEVPGEDGRPMRLSFVDVGPATRLNVFEIAGNSEAARRVPMFGRGRIDHVGFAAASQEAFDTIRDRLIARGATDGFVTDFGTDLSLFFRDPDGLEAEVLLPKPGTSPADVRPPGTPAEGYERVT